MAEPHRTRSHFDERAVEEELERVRGALEECRERRKQAIESFDAFLRSFRDPPVREVRGGEPRALDPRARAARSHSPYGSLSASSAGAPEAGVRAQPVEGPAAVALTADTGSLYIATVGTAADATAPIEIRADAAIHLDHSSTAASPEVETIVAPDRSPAGAPVVVSDAAPAAARSADPEFFDPRALEAWLPPSAPTSAPMREETVLQTAIPTSPEDVGSPQAELPAPLPLARQWRRLAPALRLRHRHMIAAVAILIPTIGLFVWLLGSGTGDDTAEPAAAAPSATATKPADVPTATSSAPTSAFQVELATLRRVWVRIIVDGQRAVEREIPANERIPINPQQTVVIRAGDAGAVRVTVNGKDAGPFGTDGFPATRTFNRPQ